MNNIDTNPINKVQLNQQRVQNNFTQEYYPLDRILKCYFHFQGSLDLTHIESSNQFFKRNISFHNKIVQYLIGMIEGVCSKSFDLLVNEECTQSQTKCYASKNILENIKYLCDQISKIILQAQKINKKKKQQGRQNNVQGQLKQDDFFIKKKDSIMQQQREENLQDKVTKQIKRRYFNLQIQKQYLKQMVKEAMQKSQIQTKTLPLLKIQKQNEIIKQQNSFQENEQRISHLDNLIREIIQFICSDLSIYVKQVFYKYPSTPRSGYSRKLKETIKNIDFRQEFAFDFLYLNQIAIHKTFSRQQIISKIMQFLNKAIKIPYQTIDNKNESYYQSFVKFNKNLVWIISQSFITQKGIRQGKQYIVSQPSAYGVYSANTSNNNNLSVETILLYKFLVCPSQGNIKNLKQFVKEAQKLYKDDDQFVKQFQKDIAKYERQHKFLANSKVSKNTLQFQQIQIKNGQLKIKNSALLRILVKWTQDIKETIQSSQKYIRDNSYNFKMVQKYQDQKDSLIKIYKNQLIKLGEQQRNFLYKSIKRQYNQIEHKKHDNNMFVVDALMEQTQQIQYSFENSLKFSSQINNFIAKQTVQELISLINVCLQAPQRYLKEEIFLRQEQINKQNNLSQQQKQEQIVKLKNTYLRPINLVSNRIGDLLRSKICCTQPQFIKLLLLLYQLDKYCYENSISLFKLIRIKNKLKQATNNVLINYMFHNKIQCELQICFMVSQDKKIEKTNAMHHYLYELTRGIYGILPQLANIINQNDPISKNNQSRNLKMEKYSSKSIRINEFQERIIRKAQKEGYLWRCIYKRCNQFSLQGSNKFIRRQGKENKYECLKCYRDRNKKQNICISLSKLQYEEQNKWIKQFLEEYDNLGIEQISKLKAQENNLKGIYLTIYPTQKKIVIDFIIIFYQKSTEKYIIKSLSKDNNSNAEELNKNIYKDHFNRKKMYLKVNYYLIMKYLQQYKLDKYLICLKVKHIESIKYLGIQQINNNFLKRQIWNKQQNLRLNQRKQIIKSLQEQIERYVLIIRLHAQNIGIFDIGNYNKLGYLKQLYLKNNQIQGKIHISYYYNLTYIDLSSNKIQEIQFINTPNLNKILLNNNYLTQFKYGQLIYLQILQMQHNQFKQSINLSKLPQLKSINLSYNEDLSQINLANCQKIQKISFCNQFNVLQEQKIIIQKMIQLSELKMSSININFLQELNVDRLQSIKLKLSPCLILELLKKQFKCLKYMDIRLQKQRQEVSILDTSILPQRKSQSIQRLYDYIGFAQLLRNNWSYVLTKQRANQPKLFIKMLINQIKWTPYIKNMYCIQEQLKHNELLKDQTQQQAQLTQVSKIKDYFNNQGGFLAKLIYKQFQINQILQQLIINNQSQLMHLNIQDKNLFMQQLDLSKVLKPLQSITIKSLYLRELKINKSKKITIITNLSMLQIIDWNYVCEFKAKDINLAKLISFINIQDIPKEKHMLQNLLQIKSIQLSTKNNQIIKSFKCNNNQQLNSIQITQLNTCYLSITNCQKLQFIHLESTNMFYIRRAIINTHNLKEFTLIRGIIDQLTLTISAKSIRKINLKNLIVKNGQVFFNEGSDAEINLQELQLNSFTLRNTQILSKLYCKINHVKEFKYSINQPPKSIVQCQQQHFWKDVICSKEQYMKERRFFGICKSIQILKFSQNIQFKDPIKIIIDIPIKIISIQLIKKFRVIQLQFEKNNPVKIHNYKQVQLINKSMKKLILEARVYQSQLKGHWKQIKKQGEIQLRMENQQLFAI